MYLAVVVPFASALELNRAQVVPGAQGGNPSNKRHFCYRKGVVLSMFWPFEGWGYMISQSKALRKLVPSSGHSVKRGQS